MIDFSLVVFILCFIIVQVVISFEVRSIEFVHIPMRSIIIAVYYQCSILSFCGRLVCPYLIEEQLLIGLIADLFS